MPETPMGLRTLHKWSPEDEPYAVVGEGHIPPTQFILNALWYMWLEWDQDVGDAISDLTPDGVSEPRHIWGRWTYDDRDNPYGTFTLGAKSEPHMIPYTIWEW